MKPADAAQATNCACQRKDWLPDKGCSFQKRLGGGHGSGPDPVPTSPRGCRVANICCRRIASVIMSVLAYGIKCKGPVRVQPVTQWLAVHEIARRGVQKIRYQGSETG